MAVSAAPHAALPEVESRQGEILRDLLREYMRGGEPVSSRTLARLGGAQLSPATVRNVLADLADLGLISHPHTSAGGVPTDEAIRLYAREEAGRAHPSQEQVRALGASLRQALLPEENAGDLDAFAAAAARELARLSRQLALILLPPLHRLRLRHIELLPYEGRRVLAIVAGDDGQVRHRMVACETLFTANDLAAMSGFLREHCLGMTLTEAREFLERERTGERARYDARIAGAARLGEEAFATPEAGTLRVEGTGEWLAAAAQKSDGADLASLCRAIEDKGRWVELMATLSVAEPGTGFSAGAAAGASATPQVLVGDEMGTGVLSDLALLTVPYFRGDTPLGSLAIVGPKRMQYAQLCGQVSALAVALSELISEGR